MSAPSCAPQRVGKAILDRTVVEVARPDADHINGIKPCLIKGLARYLYDYVLQRSG